MLTGPVLIAPDKFKGSLSANEVAAAVAAGIARSAPGIPIVTMPIADGGDGTLDAAIAAGYRRVPVEVTGPTGQRTPAAIAVRGSCAVIELAMASGLAALPGGKTSPLGAGTRGTGELIVAALDLGCTEITLGVGGSASTDGGTGMLQGLGARLTDSYGHELGSGGGALAALADVDLTGLDRRLKRTHFTLASDVSNPLLGRTGAAVMFAPQKGATRAEVALLEEGLTRWGALVQPQCTTARGAGAAGGAGFAALAVLQAVYRNGIDVILDMIGFHDHLARASLVITGEGSLDEQSLHGKAPVGVAAVARIAGTSVVAVCGRCSLDNLTLANAGIRATYCLSDLHPDPAVCMREAAALLTTLGYRIATEWLT